MSDEWERLFEELRQLIKCDRNVMQCIWSWIFPQPPYRFAVITDPSGDAVLVLYDEHGKEEARVASRACGTCVSGPDGRWRARICGRCTRLVPCTVAMAGVRQWNWEEKEWGHVTICLDCHALLQARGHYDCHVDDDSSDE